MASSSDRGLQILEVKEAELDSWPEIFSTFGLELEIIEADGSSWFAAGAPDQLERAIEAAGVPPARCRWRKLTQADWDSVACVEGMVRWFGPLRLAVTQAPTKEGLHIEAGAAFGTGLHPSTALLLDVLVERRPSEVLDVGTGSGVLALAALRLGAKRATGIDVDADSIEVARANAVRNSLDAKLRLSTQPLASLETRYPVVLANILPAELTALADGLIRVLGPEASLWLSGLQPVHVDEVAAAYRHRGLRVVGTRIRDGWAALEIVPSW